MLINRAFWWTLAVVCFALGIIPWALLRLPYWVVKYSERASKLFMHPYMQCREVLDGRSIYDVQKAPPRKPKLHVVYKR